MILTHPGAFANRGGQPADLPYNYFCPAHCPHSAAAPLLAGREFAHQAWLQRGPWKICGNGPFHPAGGMPGHRTVVSWGKNPSPADRLADYAAALVPVRCREALQNSGHSQGLQDGRGRKNPEGEETDGGHNGDGQDQPHPKAAPNLLMSLKKSGWGTRIRTWCIRWVSPIITGSYHLSTSFWGQTGDSSSVQTAVSVSVDNLAYRRVDAILLWPSMAPMIRSLTPLLTAWEASECLVPW